MVPSKMISITQILACGLLSGVTFAWVSGTHQSMQNYGSCRAASDRSPRSSGAGGLGRRPTQSGWTKHRRIRSRYFSHVRHSQARAGTTTFEGGRSSQVASPRLWGDGAHNGPMQCAAGMPIAQERTIRTTGVATSMGFTVRPGFRSRGEPTVGRAKQTGPALEICKDDELNN